MRAAMSTDVERAIAWLSDPDLRGCGGDKQAIATIQRLEGEVARLRRALGATWDEVDSLHELIEGAGRAGGLNDVMDAHRDTIEEARAAPEPAARQIALDSTT